MLNRSGVTTTNYGAPKQILANVDLQASVGCIVPQSIGVNVGSKKIAKAGTPQFCESSGRCSRSCRSYSWCVYSSDHNCFHS